MAYVVQNMNYDLVGKWMNMSIHSDENNGINVNVGFRIEDHPTEQNDTIEMQAKRRAKEILQQALAAL